MVIILVVLSFKRGGAKMWRSKDVDWTGEYNSDFIWGDDTSTPEKDGFSYGGEVIEFRFFLTRHSERLHRNNSIILCSNWLCN